MKILLLAKPGPPLGAFTLMASVITYYSSTLKERA